MFPKTFNSGHVHVPGDLERHSGNWEVESRLFSACKHAAVVN